MPAPIDERRAGIGPLDAVAVGFIAIGVLALWTVQLFVVPTFHGMFADFGSDVHLPAVTRLALQPTLAIGATLACLALMGAGLAARWKGTWTALWST